MQIRFFQCDLIEMRITIGLGIQMAVEFRLTESPRHTRRCEIYVPCAHLRFFSRNTFCTLRQKGLPLYNRHYQDRN